MNRNPSRGLSVLSWNVRGLGDTEKCATVRNALLFANPDIACLQESNLQDFSSFKAKTFLHTKLSNNYTFNPSNGARGGIITAWDGNTLCITNTIQRPYALTNCLPLNNV